MGLKYVLERDIRAYIDGLKSDQNGIEIGIEEVIIEICIIKY